MRYRITLFAAITAVGAGLGASTIAAPQSKESTRSALDVITVTGCVEREADYRASIGEGKGGALGTGVGVANEYVLRSVQTVSNATLKPTGTSPRTFEEIYRLTGDLEHELGKAVGHEVAASGYVEVKKSNGTDQVKDLGDFKVIGWHSIADRCRTPRASATQRKK